MVLQIGNQVVYCLGEKQSIRVQQENGIPVSGSHGLVYWVGKTQVGLIQDQPGFRESPPHHFDRAVLRAVIHDDDFEGGPMGVFINRVQAFFQIIPRPVGDDTDGQVEVGLSHCWRFRARNPSK